MKVILSRTLIKKEEVGKEEKKWLLKALVKGIYEVIKGRDLPKNSELRKLYLTTVIGPRRAVFLVDIRSTTLFFLFFRSKKDPIGENITIKNPLFKVTLHKYLRLLKQDLQNKNFDTFDL